MGHTYSSPECCTRLCLFKFDREVNVLLQISQVSGGTTPGAVVKRIVTEDWEARLLLVLQLPPVGELPLTTTGSLGTMLANGEGVSEWPSATGERPLGVVQPPLVMGDLTLACCDFC